MDFQKEREKTHSNRKGKEEKGLAFSELTVYSILVLETHSSSYFYIFYNPPFKKNRVCLYLLLFLLMDVTVPKDNSLPKVVFVILNASFLSVLACTTSGP